MTYDIEKLVTQVIKVKPSETYKQPGDREAILRILSKGWKIIAFRPPGGKGGPEYFIPTGTSAVSSPWISDISMSSPRFIVEPTTPQPEFPEWE